MKKKSKSKSSNVKFSGSTCCCSGKWWGIFLIVLGVAWLLDVWNWLIPILLIVWGVSALMKRKY